MPDQKHQPLWVFILFPAVAMLLGWGLRGYIGGGPFGAMIPGAFVALTLSMLLNHSTAFAATAACFGAIAIGYGGEMTYGVTLGHARDEAMRHWGFLGVTIKGGVWGLLGGAVLGTGLIHRSLERRHIVIALLITVIASAIGIALINEPRLLDFSTRGDESRGESWGGLLFAAVAFLAYITSVGKGESKYVPVTFAILGLIGGAIGFGCGTLWLAYGPPTKWVGWWKMMEFSFGFSFGAFLGLAGWLNRDRLRAAANEGVEQPDAGGKALVGLILLVIFFFYGLPAFISVLRESFAAEAANGIATNELPGFHIGAASMKAVTFLIGMIYSFVFFGALCNIFGLWSRITAWHIAITLTFFHTILDLNEDIFGENGFAAPAGSSIIVMLITVGAVAALVHVFKNSRQPIRNLYLLVLWACYGTGTARTILHPVYFDPNDGRSFFEILIADHASIILVHGIFHGFGPHHDGIHPMDRPPRKGPSHRSIARPFIVSFWSFKSFTSFPAPSTRRVAAHKEMVGPVGFEPTTKGL
jgi:hypothetical protein